MNDSIRRRTSAAGALVLLLAVVVLAACSSNGNASVAGAYLNPKKGAIVLSEDGRFSVAQADNTVVSGTYTLDGSKITFTIGERTAGSGTIEGDKLTDPDGNVFVKTHVPQST
ncbi:MAG TPA: hypothetical protein VID47_00925 [Actinomycetota bacterium]|jgi:hypothetical protein